MVQEWCKNGARLVQEGWVLVLVSGRGKGGNLLLNCFSGVNVAFMVQ